MARHITVIVLKLSIDNILAKLEITSELNDNCTSSLLNTNTDTSGGNIWQNSRANEANFPLAWTSSLKMVRFRANPHFLRGQR